MPTARIQAPDGRVITLEVPQGATEQQILDFVQSQDLSQFQQAPAPQPEPTLSEQAQQFAQDRIGTAENVASVLSSALLEPIAGLAGLGAEGLQAVGVDVPDGADVVRSVQGFAYQPQTESGQAQQQALGSALQTTGEFVEENVLDPIGLANRGERVLEATGSPLLATLAEEAPELVGTLIGGGGALKRSLKNSAASRKAIADQIRAGNPNVDLVTKAINEQGKIVTNKRAKQALDIIKKDIGDEKAAQVVSVGENMTKASKGRVNKMLDIIEKGRKEPIFAQTNRPSDVLGDAVADRAKAINRLNQKAGKEIGDIAKNQLKGKTINIQGPAKQFFDDLSELGVRATSQDGRIKLDFSNSQFVGGGQDKIERIANFVAKGNVDGLQGHRVKQFGRELVNFGQGTESAVSARSQNIIKKLTAGIDDALDNTSNAYKRANERYAKTIGLKNDFDKLAGKDVDIFSDLSSKSLGGKARRLVSNAESRVPIEQTLINSDKVLKELGVRFKDDIPSLSHMVTQLESIFKVEPVGSFQGRIQRAGANVVQGVSPGAQAAEAISEKIFSLSKPDFDKKMKAMRSLVRTNNG